MSKASWIDRLDGLIRSLVGLIGLGLFLFMFIFFTREATKVQTWATTGSVRSAAQLVNPQFPGPDSLMKMATVEAGDFIGARYPSIGDTIVSINDTAVTPSRWNQLYDSPRQVGERSTLTWVHLGDTLSVEVIARNPRAGQLWDFISLQSLRFLIALAFCGVGLWAFFARPNVGAVRVLALFCFSMTAFTMAGVQVLSGRFAGFEIMYLNEISAVLGFLSLMFAAFWLHVNLLFPNSLPFVERRPWTAYVLCYAPSIAYFAAIVARQQRVEDWQIYFAFLVIQTLAGFAILGIRKRRTADFLQRRQITLVLWGAGLGLGTLLVGATMLNVYDDWFRAHFRLTMAVVNIMFIGLLLCPLAFAYAFGKWRLLEIEAKLKRGTRYILITGAFIAVFAALGFGIGLLLTRDMMRDNQMVVVLVAIGATALFFPAQKRIQGFIEHRIYPERQHLRMLIRDFLQRSLVLADKSTFWGELELRLQEGLFVEQVVPVVRIGQNGRYHLRGELRTPFCSDSEFIAGLQKESRPLLVDEIMASARVKVTEEEAFWLSEQQVVLVLPLVAQSQLVGFIGISRKQEREDYSAEELRILNSLAPQIALASENIRLIEDNVEKQRLEEQMRMARLIQQGFLPQHLPETPGLLMAARSKFSLEVAGDYYDVIALDSGETVFAVGDVSGKGAGAALLMANLQASLRTAIGSGSALRNTVARVNDLIFRNTPPEQYITFFVGIYEPVSRSLTYVNAGHNPPALLQAGGQTVMLETGGLILGCLPGTAYQEATITLASGDTVVMYSDGVSEAMNEKEEEFSDQRVVEFASSHRHLPPEELVCKLEEEVIAHRGKDAFDDDFTILVVRAL